MLLLFDETTGHLVATNTMTPYPCPPAMLAAATAPGQTACDVPPFEPAYWHLLGGEPRIRPRLAYEIKNDPCGAGRLVTLTGLPAGTAVTVAGPFGGEMTGDGGPVELLFQQPGEYTIALALAPYQPETIFIFAAREKT